jgi:hypothetical protein
MSILLPCLYASLLGLAALALGYWLGRRHERAVLTALLWPEKWLSH